jgi:alpha-ribazole phosphatase/probable phosphoglycerate mutase
MSDSPSTVIDLLRHGEPVGGRRYRGQRDDPLSETGWEQMRASVAGYRDWQVIVTSPLARCAAFAQELADRLDIPLHADARFMEIGFGAWEGKTPEELHAADPGCLQRFKLDPVANRPAGAEPLAMFQARVAGAWQELIERHQGRQVLLVGHAGVIRAVLGMFDPKNRISEPNLPLPLGEGWGEGYLSFPFALFPHPHPFSRREKGASRWVLAHALCMTDIPAARVFRIAVPNAGITRIRVDGQGEAAWPSLVFHGGRP